jgi:hypothetical protein
MDFTKMTTNDLKAAAFDLIEKISPSQNQLNAISQELQKRAHDLAESNPNDLPKPENE